MPLKRELTPIRLIDNGSDDEDGPMAPKLSRLNTNKNTNKVFNLTFPTEDWFSQMYGPGENTPQTLNLKTSILKNTSTSKKKMTKKSKNNNFFKTTRGDKIKINNSTITTSNEIIEIEISDGEDLNEVFPLNNKKDDEIIKIKEIEKKDKTLKIDNTNDNKKQQSTSSNFVEDNMDFIVLFESFNGNNLKKEEEDGDIEALDSDDDDNDGDIFIPSKKSSINVGNKQQPPKNSMELSFGITLIPNSQLLERINIFSKKYQHEFFNFNKAIWKHFSENLQNDHTYTWKMRVRKILDDIVKQIFPTEKISLVAVGSTVNGCGAFNSDMDLCLCMPCQPDGYDTRRNYAISRLKKVMRKLINKKGLIHDVQYIPAKVPILKIKFKHPYEKLEVDINVNNVPGIYNSYLIHYYSRIDDRFPALCLLVKHWAKKKGILDACSGYFNSYSLILMVLHFLQCGIDIPILPNLQYLYPKYFDYFRPLDEMKLFVELPKPIPEVTKNNLTIGELLIGFFNYYANFNFNEYAISVCRGCIYSRCELPRNTQRFKIFIEEPFDFKNTARCVTNEGHYEEIIETFKEAVEILSNKPPSLKRLLSSSN